MWILSPLLLLVLVFAVLFFVNSPLFMLCFYLGLFISLIWKIESFFFIWGALCEKFWILMESYVCLLCSFCSRIWDVAVVNVIVMFSASIQSYSLLVVEKKTLKLIYLCTPQKMGLGEISNIFYQLSFFSGYPRSPILSPPPSL